MNIARYALEKRVVMYLFTILLVGGGVIAYEQLGRLEDPEFTIKEALVVTHYPGASPQETADEVTDKIETAVQQLGQLKRVTSLSYAGLSIVTVEIKDRYDKTTLPQVWDELRRKVGDVQGSLPPGTSTSIVNDDYGDVFGVFFAITGQGFPHRELYEYAKDLRRELLLVQDVAKVELFGVQHERVYVEMSRSRMAELGISQEEIYATLKRQNMIVPSGQVQVGPEYLRISPTGMHQSVEEIGNLLVKAGDSGEMIFLKDFARVERGYVDPPQAILRFDGEQAIGLGISTVQGGNVVNMGRAVRQKLEVLKANLPLGIELREVYYQPRLVTEAVDGFVVSLLQAVAIVIVVLMVFMGLRSGLLVGVILLLTIAGTFILMKFWAISLQRISLGALIIALGMLVDNAIVIVEGILVGIQKGMDRTRAALDTVSQNAWPLLGATVIAILAFSGIGLSQDSTGEYTYSLFQVILISLSLSWLLAVTLTPLFGVLFLPSPKAGAAEDPYGGKVYRMYKGMLLTCLRHRLLTLGALAGLLALAIVGFGEVKRSFFPDSTLNMFYVDYWAPQGTHIRDTEKDLKRIESWVLSLDEVESVTTVVGQGSLRFMLTYAPEKQNSSYGQLLISVKESRMIPGLMPKIDGFIRQHFPSAKPVINRFVLGPGGGFKIEARFRGPDPAVLRELAEKAKKIIGENPPARDIRDDWRDQVKLIVPVFSETRARRAGISRPDLADALQMTFSGLRVGLYREEDELLPIISRPPQSERTDVDNIFDTQVWSPANRRMIPIQQVVTEFKTTWEDPIIARRNRLPTITVQCNPPADLPASVVLAQLKPKIESIPVPPGYELQWGGEFENSADAQAALNRNLPFSFLLMGVIIFVLFNRLRQPLIIFLTVPLAVIGVTAGLLLTRQPFGFMALLGFLSLSGMLIKNAVVLIDQINIDIAAGKDTFKAVVDSGVSRMRPVAMAALTTMLGLIPLLSDAFFVAMAVTIIFGLAFATALTLIVVPVMYVTFYRVPYREGV